MEEVGVNFVELKGKVSKVTLRHNLWGDQVFKCDCLNIINDEHRIGVIIKGREIFMYKKDVIQETESSISNGKLTIIVNKL